MPFQKNRKRDYKRELAWEKANGNTRVKDRALRNSARKKMKLKVGDSREVDHKTPLVAGGTNDKKNLRIVSAKTNARKEANRKKAK